MERVLRAVHALNRLMRLSQLERWLVMEAGFYLLCAKLATMTTPARTLLALGSVEASAGAGADKLPTEIAQAVAALDRSSRQLRFANCLVRAMALRMLLARRQIATEIHIGARKDEQGEFAAHAWLTCDGTILVGGDDANHLYRELVDSSHAVLH